jgi:trimeric autotransporter adhesin
MIYTPSNWYWQVTGVGIYGSARGGLVSAPTSDAAYLAFAAINGPGAIVASAAALDEILTAAGLPVSGLTPPAVASLQTALVAAASTAAAAVTAQIYTDPAHQAAGQNAGVIVTMSGGAPTSSSPFFSAFNAYAAAWGLAPAAFATLIEVLINQSLALSGALNALEAASSAATTAAQLATALSTFETALNAIVAAINAAGTPFPMTAPAAISIVGINA